MGSIGRYIFRTTLGAFAVVLVCVTMLMWITQALRNIDLMTNQGQTILVFVALTSLIIPLLVLLIAPIALMIAVAYVLNKLGNDSELIVMNAAGMRPWQVFRPFLATGIVVALLVAAIALYVAPMALHDLRHWASQVRAEFVANSIVPGKFAAITDLILHVRDRQPNGQLSGIMVDDRRDPKDRITILAEKGDMLTNERGVYLLLQNGTLQRREVGKRDPVIVAFTEYALDLSRVAPSVGAIRYSVQERFTHELMYPAADDAYLKEQAGQVRAEVHNRLTAPLYPLAFLVIVFAFLGAPRTTRQSRMMSLVGAVAVASVIRGVGFVGAVAGAKTPMLLALPYITLGLTFVLGFWAIARGVIIEPPALISNAVTALVEFTVRRSAAVMEQAR
jgi:lipopolysaccharide export system permease protein